MCVGIGLMGLFVAMVYTPVITEVNTEMAKYYGEKYRASISDRSAALSNQTFGLGGILGPLIGGALTDQIGF